MLDKKLRLVKSGQRHAQARRYRDAIDAYEQALALDPRDVRLQLKIADLSERRGVGSVRGRGDRDATLDCIRTTNVIESSFATIRC